MPAMLCHRRKGATAHALGIAAETAACESLARDGWTVLGRRLRTEAGEIDLLAERDGLLAIVEVKARPTLADAAIVLAEHPDWGANGVRFDVLVVDAAGTVRRIADAFRQEG